MAFKHLAAFSKSPVILPSSVEEHPDWLRHQRQRDDLATALSAATADVSRFERERAQADHDVQEAQVLKFLGEEPATAAPDAEARIVEVNAAIATSQARLAAIAEAIRRLDARGDALRSTIQSEMRGAIEASAPTLSRNSERFCAPPRR